VPAMISRPFKDNAIGTWIEMSRPKRAPRHHVALCRASAQRRYHPSGTVTGLSPRQTVLPLGRKRTPCRRRERVGRVQLRSTMRWPQSSTEPQAPRHPGNVRSSRCERGSVETIPESAGSRSRRARSRHGICRGAGAGMPKQRRAAGDRADAVLRDRFQSDLRQVRRHQLRRPSKYETRPRAAYAASDRSLTR
jgi:hypothetical protein